MTRALGIVYVFSPAEGCRPSRLPHARVQPLQSMSAHCQAMRGSSPPDHRPDSIVSACVDLTNRQLLYPLRHPLEMARTLLYT